ncbi:tissue factor-like [Chelmon rostratus]|uniref:tissue factor-like n=1 Tax=Chelmon rostratus TaxID=109905 RepID=UPI001BEAA99A|nr:tissue factor-like [Chelmon rostratus]
MAPLKTVLYLGLCLSVWIITTADVNVLSKVEGVHWVSLDFKTILNWTATAANDTYTVLYSEDGREWNESPDCIRVSESECDLSSYLEFFNRTFTADIVTEPVTMDYEYGLEDLPHTYSLPFNPYTGSNISAVKFTVEALDDGRIIVNITDPLTSIHRRGKQLSIRDVLKNDLKYKISYYKSGSTGKRDIISDSSMAEVSKLDAGQRYCFMVAAFIPSRPKATRQGPWSIQQCTPRDSNVVEELSTGAWVGIVFILLTVLIIIITVTVLCCRCCQQRNKSLHSSQSSAPI